MDNVVRMPGSTFEPIELAWGGNTYTIPANRVLRVIAKIEEHVTISDLANGVAIPFAKSAMAYAAVLRFAGARVTDDEVYAALWEEGGQADVTKVLIGLLSIMLPPSQRKKFLAAMEAPPTPDLEEKLAEAVEGNGQVSTSSPGSSS